MSTARYTNPFLNLPYESAIAALGEDYADIVAPAEFPKHIVRWRNDDLLPLFGLDPAQVSDDDFREAFGHFRSDRPCWAWRYHGYQFGEYNPQLGDGRGFVYGQVRSVDQELYDFGTKGSGRTPYSRTADGRLTLKGGLREVLAAEALHRLGVRTSRCLSLIETGEQLWRGDEPSPTRSSVMVRCSRSHIRFGTFERLHWLRRPELIRRLLDHVIAIYYPHLLAIEAASDRDAQFYAELVERTATLSAQWMAAGFCHAVLNTDNMSITGESFDYGPYAFIPNYDLKFTAAYFDHYGRYCYANQPAACFWNLEKLQAPLSLVMDKPALDQGLAKFARAYQVAYCDRMVARLGFTALSEPETDDLLTLTLDLLLAAPQLGYNQFFAALRREFQTSWRDDPNQILAATIATVQLTEAAQAILAQWRSHYHQLLIRQPLEAMGRIAQQLGEQNPLTILLRPEIERVWESIAVEDDWTAFYDLIKQLQAT